MTKNEVVIVGGGLAGLHAARLLCARGVDVVLVEARDRLGGRILSAGDDGGPSEDGFDLGPSWFWPHMQPAFGALVDQLGLASFPQAHEGDVIIERMSRETPRRYRGMLQEPQSMRLSGGTSALVRALAKDIPSDRILLGTRVTAMSLAADGVQLALARMDGTTSALFARHVIAALPPRLLEATVRFTPAQDDAIGAKWRDTPTWMAPHAKFFALYDRAFWRDAGLSGTAQSMVGPLVEIHDATTSSGKPALFGFLGIGAAQRAALGEALSRACIDQLARIFGAEARRPRATVMKDWAADPLTATVADQDAGGHPEPGKTAWISGAWAGWLSLAGSETSPIDPGYLAGAVVAAERAVGDVRKR